MPLRLLPLITLLSFALACGGAQSSSGTSGNASAPPTGTLVAFEQPLDTAAPWAPITAPGRSREGLLHNYLVATAPALRQCGTGTEVQLAAQLEADDYGHITAFTARIQDPALIGTLNCLVMQFVAHPITQLPATAALPSAPGAVTVQVTLVLR